MSVLTRSLEPSADWSQRYVGLVEADDQRSHAVIEKPRTSPCRDSPHVTCLCSVLLGFCDALELSLEFVPKLVVAAYRSRRDCFPNDLCQTFVRTAGSLVPGDRPLGNPLGHSCVVLDQRALTQRNQSLHGLAELLGSPTRKPCVFDLAGEVLARPEARLGTQAGPFCLRADGRQATKEPPGEPEVARANGARRVCAQASDIATATRRATWLRTSARDGTRLRAPPGATTFCDGVAV